MKPGMPSASWGQATDPDCSLTDISTPYRFTRSIAGPWTHSGARSRWKALRPGYLRSKVVHRRRRPRHSSGPANLGPFAGTVALIASVCEEEVEGAALAGFVQRFQPDFAVTSEPNDTRLCIGQRGRAKVELRVEGRACDAGFAQEGLNAAEALALVIAQVRNLEHPVHDRLGERDITCIDIASWPYPSVSTVPGEALGRFDCRFLPGETAMSLHDELQSCVERALATWTERPEVTIGLVQAEFATWTGATYSAEEFEPAWWTDQESPLVQGAMAGLASVGLDPTPTHYSFCTNGSYLSGVAGIPTIGFGVGYEHMAHQVDEYVTLDSLLNGAQGFAALVTELVAQG